MNSYESTNISFKSLYFSKHKALAESAYGEELVEIKPNLEKIATDIDLYVKLPKEELSIREYLKITMINPKYNNFIKKITKKYKQGGAYTELIPINMLNAPDELLGFLLKMKEALLKSNSQTGEIYKVYYTRK